MIEQEQSILDDPVARLLLDGTASTPSEAERLYLEEHLGEIFSLVHSELSDEEFRGTL